MFINNLINMKQKLVRIYLPPDVNSFLQVIEKCFNSKRTINLIVSTKQDMPSWLTTEEAHQQVTAGVSIWKFASSQLPAATGDISSSTSSKEDEERRTLSPDVVLAGCGNEVMVEVIAAARMLQKDVPLIKIRVVNVIDLLALDISRDLPNALDEESFCSIFTPDKPVIFNFHGYPSAIYQVLFGRTHAQRFTVLGYLEEGTTTTPFKMLTMNKVSRFHVAAEALRKVSEHNMRIALDAHLLISNYLRMVEEHDEYILLHGKDPEYLSQMEIF